MPKLISPVSIESAPDSAKPILEEVQKKYGMVPNLMGNFAHNPDALKAYLALGDSFAASGLSALEQQIVALTVSRENNCAYCMAAHSAISAMSKLDEKIIQQLRAGESLSDSRLEALRAFTKRIVAARGWVDDSDVKQFLGAGYAKEQLLAVIVGVTMKTLSNYVNHISKTEVDEAFKPFVWSREK
ncbi:MAG: carboxymuconolactone decarboxylase [Bdellovibrio sp. CG10_big_fil_rev_8_21_14_0_10_47_8]|nr:MAG: carboxymuconolactone decarboxylase [Bdellovibrio sp. CG10_big_fil_rev_8_21_14_0_10_47_8]